MLQLQLHTQLNMLNALLLLLVAVPLSLQDPGSVPPPVLLALSEDNITHSSSSVSVKTSVSSAKTSVSSAKTSVSSAESSVSSGASVAAPILPPLAAEQPPQLNTAEIRSEPPVLPSNSIPIISVQPLPPVPIPDTPKFDVILTEHNIDFAALYSIIRNNVDILREQVFHRLYCSRGVCTYPSTPLVVSQATKYYVTARKNYSILVTITLAPREPLQDRIVYQVDVDNIIVSQLRRQYAQLELYLKCFKRICYVPTHPFTGTEVNAYCNYQDLTEACMFVTTNIIVNFESDFDNSLKINKGEAGNVAVTSVLH